MECLSIGLMEYRIDGVHCLYAMRFKAWGGA